MTEDPARNADNFILSPGQTTIAEIHFWGVYQTGTWPPLDHFSIRIHNNDTMAIPNQPSASLAANVEVIALQREAAPYALPPPDPYPGIAIYEYTAEIMPISLAANTLYWLSISNHSGLVWGWLNDNSAGLGYDAQFFDGSQWFSNQTGHAMVFDLTGPAVPEPSAYLLGALALLGLIAFRRKLGGAGR